MASIDSMTALLVEQLRDIYDAEKRLTKAIPKLARKAVNDELRSVLKDHLAETEEQVSRLEQAFEHLGERAKGKPCAGMKGIIEEGDAHVGEDYDDDDLRDAVIIGAAQRVEHYEMAAYGTAIAHARLLLRDDVADLLEQSLEEEKAADKKLTDIAESAVNLEAASDYPEEVGRGYERPVRRASSSLQRSTAASSSRAKGRSSKKR